MFKKQKKFMALLLAAVMALSLAACGGSNDGATTTADPTPTPAPVDNTQVGQLGEVTGGEGSVEITDEGYKVGNYVFSPDQPRTIKMYVISDSADANPDNRIYNLMKEELGVTIEMTKYGSGDQEVQNQLLIAAGGGDYDIIAQSDQNATVIKEDVLVDLQPLLDSGDYPLLKEHVRTNLAKIRWTGGEVPDGLYVLPDYNRWYGQVYETQPSNTNGFYIQKAVLEDLGYPDLSNMTLEKYFGWLRDYKAKYPTIDGAETIAFTLDNGRAWAIPNMPAVLEGSPNNGGVVTDVTKSPHTVRSYATDEYAYRTWKFLNEMYAEGLIDPIGGTTDDYNAKLSQGRVLGTFHQDWALGTPRGALRNEGKWDRLWVVTMPTWDNIPPYYAWLPTMNVQQGMGINANSTLETGEILAFLEIMMTEKWQKILFWGIEGEDYLVDADGVFYRTPEMREQQDNDLIWQASNQARAFRDRLPKHQGLWPDGNTDSPGNQPGEFIASLSDYDANFLQEYNAPNWTAFVNEIPTEEPPYYPLWQRTWISQDAQDADGLMGSISGEYIPKLIMCDPAEFEAIWSEYVEKFEAIDQTDWLASHEAWIEKYGWNPY